MESQQTEQCEELNKLQFMPNPTQQKYHSLSCFAISDKIKNFEATINAANPIISKDGSEIAMINSDEGANVSIFKINNKNNYCEKTDTIGFRGSKINFDHPRNDGTKRIAFTGMPSDAEAIVTSSSGPPTVIVYDRESKKNFSIEHDSKKSDSYPSFLRDGRVVYYESGNESNPPKFVYIDPNQYFDNSNCIKAKVKPNIEPLQPKDAAR